MLLATIFEEHCDSLKSIFRLLHNEKRAVHNIIVYCEERYAERKNKEKSCYTDFQETDFRVLAQGGKILCSCMDSRILLRKTRRYGLNTFSLKLIACDKVFYDGPCEILIFDGFDGEMAIMANHEPMTCSVETGELRFRVPGETTWQEAIVSTGLLKVEHNKVDIIVYSAERPEEIDKFRAEAALERAKEQLAQKQSIMEYHVSTASMARAMARLRGVKNHDV